MKNKIFCEEILRKYAREIVFSDIVVHCGCHQFEIQIGMGPVSSSVTFLGKILHI